MRTAPVPGNFPIALFRSVQSRAKTLFARYGKRDSGKRQKLFYPTLEDATGAPRADLDSPDSLSASEAPPELNRSDFYNWGSE